MPSTTGDRPINHASPSGWREDLHIMLGKDAHHLLHIGRGIDRQCAQFFEERVNVGAEGRNPNHLAGDRADVAKAVRNVAREVEHGSGRSLVGLPIDEDIEDALDDVAILVLVFVGVRRHEKTGGEIVSKTKLCP
jgi:hypothetical protein